jgi:CHAT domain-containing protein
MTTGEVVAPAATEAADDFLTRLRQLEDDAGRRPLLLDALARQEPDALVAALKAEAERLWYVDPHASLRVADAIVLAADLAGCPQHTALGLMAGGDALRYLGRYPESLARLDEAGERYLSLGDEVGWARTRIGWVVSSHRLGRGLEVFETAGRARDIFVRRGERLRAGGLTLNTAVVSCELGRYEQALRLYDEAEALYASLGPAAEVRAAWARANKAIILSLLGDFRAALDLHQRARDVFAQHGETLGVLHQDQNIAYVHAGLGDYTRALRLLTEAFATADRAGLDEDAIAIALNLVECYQSLNRQAEALDLARETIERAERCGTPTEAAKARIVCSESLARLGDVEAALALLEEAVTTFASAGLTYEIGMVALQRARLHLANADWAAAGREADAAHSVFAERGLVVRQAQADLIRARAVLGLGDPGRAVQLALGALAVTRERETAWLAHQGHHILARAAEAAGDVEGSLAAYRDAIASIEQVQSRVAGELRTNFLDDKLAVYHDAIALCLRLDRPALAFEYLERAKSRALVDYLAANPEVRLRARGAGDQALVDDLTRLRREHNWYCGRLYGHGMDAAANASPVEAGVLAGAIRDREKRIARLQERLALRSHDLAGIVAPLTPEALRPPDLGARTLLLEYYFREDGGAVFVRTAGDLRVVPLETDPRTVHGLLRRWQLSLDATARALAAGLPLAALQRNTLGTLTALYRALIEPLAPSLEGHARLVVIPHGPTHAVPWHALFDGRQHLLERLEVATCPASSLLRLCTARQSQPSRDPGSALVVAFSDGGRLPYVLEEARTVAQLFPGERYLERDATEAHVVAAAPRHGIIHLAAHGEARLDNPAFAHLQLADGQLTTGEVFNLNLDGALVTLSACETGRSVVTGGDELIGLARGFLFAGASTLVQSLWRVEDGSTARLMARFYGALRSGSSRGAALRTAQLSLLAEGYPPFCWAPFQLVGDSGPLPPPGESPPGAAA